MLAPTVPVSMPWRIRRISRCVMFCAKPISAITTAPPSMARRTMGFLPYRSASRPQIGENIDHRQPAGHHDNPGPFVRLRPFRNGHGQVLDVERQERHDETEPEHRDELRDAQGVERLLPIKGSFGRPGAEAQKDNKRARLARPLH